MGSSASIINKVTAKAPDFHSGFANLEQEHSYWIDDVQGRIPSDLRGTFFRNGPGSMRIGGQEYGHWFDGPGMVSAVTFVDGKAHYKNKYVRTPKYIAEKRAGHIVARGYGTQRRGSWLNNIGHLPSNPANTNVYYHAGKLGAYYEGGQPYTLDPYTLDTLGVDLCNGALTTAKCLSAHGKINQRTGHFINFGVSVEGVGLEGFRYMLEVYDFDAQGKSGKTCRIPLRKFPFLHDFGVTENYAVLFVSSLAIQSMLKPSLGFCSIFDVTRYDKRAPVDVLVVDLRTMKMVRRFQTDPGLIVHFANSWEQGDEIITDFMLTRDLSNFWGLKNILRAERIIGAPYVRYRLNLRTGSVQHEVLNESLPGEFPAWDTRLTGYRCNTTYWVSPVDNGSGEFFNTLVKMDLNSGTTTSWDYGEHRYTSEALFVPRAGSTTDDDGYVVSFVYDARDHRTDVVIVDATSMQEEVARLRLRHHVPFGFHGHWTDSVFTK